VARARAISVIGSGEASARVRKLAFEVGLAVAQAGAVLVSGGRGGVMEAASAGARSAGGHTIGIVPGYGRGEANRHIEFAIATGIGEARNVVVVASGDAVIALEGEAGTLSEIGLAMKIGRPVVALDAWRNVKGPHRAANPAAAVALALRLAAERARRR
jgi:uncharacterized protein (TIGR00725 family)